MDCERDVEPVKHQATIAAAFDVEDQWHVAHRLRRPRCQRGGFRDEARTHDAATAVLEIVTGKLPLNLVCHRSLLVALQPKPQIANELRLETCSCIRAAAFPLCRLRTSPLWLRLPYLSLAESLDRYALSSRASRPLGIRLGHSAMSARCAVARERTRPAP